MKTKYHIIAIITLSLGLFTCESVDLDLQESPNELTLEQSDPDLILNNIQLKFATLWSQFNNPDLQLVRMENQRNTYAANIDETTLQDFTGNPSPYTDTYELLKDTDALIEIALNQENPLYFHIGMAQFFKAYSFVTLVDHLGPVPFEEANLPDDFPNPKLDSGEAIYEASYDLLDEAIENFSQEIASTDKPTNDLFYDGNADYWIKAANSLRLKMLITTRRVTASESTSGINQIIESGNYINDQSEDFKFQYSSSISPADSRHPLYRANYSAAYAADYMSNDFIHLIKDVKEFVDPRLRYYIYRQTGTEPTGDFLPCDGLDRFNYCYTGDLYWGRDHKDTQGIPPDSELRSTYGIYPAGGAYDNGNVDDPGSFRNVVENPGLNGAGISPMWMSSFTSFTLAEAALTLNTSGEPRDYLEEGISRSFAAVESLSGIPMEQSQKENYINGVLEEFDSGSNEEKLKIVMTEYYLALFGNGIEAYNTYRRTGYPDFPPGVISEDENFANIYLYPIDATTANENIQQRPRDERVFWDTLPSSEIN